ncbi:MAG TPA: T9SS type A sorting domain-containing protein [Bacteroidia bacterium]|nr:T9SS type A sorting domain-containing protein [Bacteroidia bacterium]
MKRNLLHLALVFVCISNLYAASGGPDTYGYIWKDSNEPGGPLYTWIDITNLPGTIQVSGLSDDNNSGPYPIGFNFQFYWYSVSQFWVGSNGYVAFNNSQISSPFPTIPTTAQPNNFVAPFAADLNFDGASNTGTVHYWTNTNNDTLIVSYDSVPFWSASAANGYINGANSFQIIFSQVDSSITFQYKLQSGTSGTTTNFLSIGIENNSGNIGLQHSTGQYPVNNYAVKYYYPSNSTYQVSDAAVLWNNNQETGAKFLLNNGPAFSLTSTIKNTGNQNLSPFNVQSQVLDASNTVIVTSSTTATVNNPSDEQLITQNNTFTPTANGTYSFVSSTQLTGDATPSNNSKTMEIVVVDTNSVLVNLQYCDNTSEGPGLSWQGGNGGVGVYFEPPFSPFVIQRLEYFIVSDPQAVGFTAKVNANDGINNSPGTELLSISVPNSSITANSWNQVLLGSPLTVNDTGVYVSWIMNGDGITIGQDETLPLSNQTFEVLGAGWAINRYREIEDIMIRMVVSTPTGALTNLKEFENKSANNIFPIPFSNQLNLKLKDAVQNVNIYNSTGQLITSFNSYGAKIYNVDTSNWPSGVYLVQIMESNHVSTQKMVKE